jgi:hypothetical protein
MYGTYEIRHWLVNHGTWLMRFRKKQSPLVDTFTAKKLDYICRGSALSLDQGIVLGHL